MPATPRDRPGAAALAGAAVTGLIAFVLFLAGGLLLWADAHYKDADGFLSTGSEHFATSDYALTAGKLELDGHWLLSSDRYGTVRLTARSTAGKPTFVGIARTRDLTTYLRQVAHSEVDDIAYAPFKARYTPRPGTQKPKPPAGQPIWVAAAHGDGTQTMTWDVEPGGDYSAVVMNADGTRGVSTSLSAGAKVPAIAGLAYVALGLGIVFIIATAALTTYGTRPAPQRALVPAPRPAGTAVQGR